MLQKRARGGMYVVGHKSAENAAVVKNAVDRVIAHPKEIIRLQTH